ncbi:secretion protein EspA [uncultured Shewanella sp.]|uniref:secretion protein EspA n=1 Tax=uncultured Shewanella sp. TaxID=173975 RepID=UPI0026085519|nr:secretion protein EspA [uncultured Shewanella sp.]
MSVTLTSSVTSSSSSSSQSDYIKATSGSNILSQGIAILYTFMNTLSSMADTAFTEMQTKSDVTNEAQKLLTYIDNSIADATTGDVTDDDGNGVAALDYNTYTYMVENNIEVDGVSINEYLGLSSDSSDKNTLYSSTEVEAKTIDSGSLNAIRAEIESVSNTASDYVSTSQLTIQKLMQTYNVTVSLINSMQTLIADMCKSIAQNIR